MSNPVDKAEVSGIAENPSRGGSGQVDLEDYHGYFQFAPDGMLVVDQHGKILQVNPAACRITGYSDEELLSMEIMDLIPPEDVSVAAAHFHQTVEIGEANGDVYYRTKSGERRIYSVRAVKITEDRFIGFVQDVTEHRLISDSLRASEERLKFAQDATRDGLWDWNLITNEAYFSPQYYRMLGYEPGEFPGSYAAWKNLVHPDDMLVVEPVIFTAIAERTQFDFEFRMRTKSDEWLWIRARGRVVAYTAEGLPARMTGTHTDISARKATEHAFKTTQERLLRAERVAKSGNWEFHMKTGRLFASDGAVAIYGLSSNDLPIKDVQNFPLPEYRSMLDEALRVLIEDSATYDVEFKVVNPLSGDVVDIHSIAEFDSEREIVFGVIQDVTETKKAQAALQKIEWMLNPGQFRHSNQSAGEFLPAAYGDLTVLNQNRTLLDAVGKDVLEAISGDYLDLLETSSAVYEINGDYALGIFSSGWCQFMDRASRRLCGDCSNHVALNSGKWLCHESCWNEATLPAIETGAAIDVECKGGIHLYAIPIWVNGKVAGGINFGYGDPPKDRNRLKELADLYQVDLDTLAHLSNQYESRPPFIVELAKERLTVSARLIGALVERHLAEQSLKQLNAELEQRVTDRTAALHASTEEMEAFVYSVSHDLRAPLRAVDGFSGMLMETYGDKLDATAHRYLQTVHSNVNRMDLLITELLALSRINRSELLINEIKMGDVVRKELAESFPAEKRQHCSIEIGLLPDVKADEILIRQVWHNLIDNAIKYSRIRTQAHIMICGRREPGRVVYSVADNGIGFNTAYSQKLFGVFQRLHSEAGIEGTGIGLAIVDRIIRRHGGEVWAEGVEGEGATFSFSLPDRS